MNNRYDFHYIEIDDSVNITPVEEPRVKGLLSLIFGIVSIVFGGVVGIVLGALARRFATPILEDFEGTSTAKMAKAGKITGTVGLALSIIGLILAVIVVIAVAALVVFLLMPAVESGAIALGAIGL